MGMMPPSAKAAFTRFSCDGAPHYAVLYNHPVRSPSADRKTGRTFRPHRMLS